MKILRLFFRLEDDFFRGFGCIRISFRVDEPRQSVADDLWVRSRSLAHDRVLLSDRFSEYDPGILPIRPLYITAHPARGQMVWCIRMH